MAQDGVFNVGQSDLDADFMQDINDIAVEDFPGSKFDEISMDQRELFENVLQDLKIANIEEDPDAGLEGNIERLLQIAKVLQLGVLHTEHQQEAIRKENEDLTREMAERDTTDAVQLIDEVREKNQENQQLLKNIKEVEREVEERQDEITSLVNQHKAEKERLVTLEAEMREMEEKKYSRDQEFRDLRQEIEELKRNQSDKYGMEEASERVKTEKDRLAHKLGEYQKTQRDLRDQKDEIQRKYKQLILENDEDKAKLVELYDMQSSWKHQEVELESKVEDLLEEREMLHDQMENLKIELDDKITLFEELSARFERQYGSWEQEREVLVGQIDALEQGGAGVPRTPGSTLGDRQPSLRKRSMGGVSMGAFDEEIDSVEALQEELAIMREEQVLLMEAYEALENDVGKEIDKALEEQAGMAEETTGRLRVTQEELKAQYELVAQLQDQVGTLEERCEEAEVQAERFLSGNYGLGDAVHDVKTLKERLKADQLDMEKKVDEVNRYAAKLEEALEENLWLKRKAGLPEDITIDVADLKLARQGQMMQVKAMNAMLEEENMRLEEDVRRLKHEVRFRTKWEGLNAAGLGLTPEQLQLLELKAEQIKFGRVDSKDEEFLRLQKRIQYLEGRLGEAQAYAGLPVDMREPQDEGWIEQQLPKGGARAPVSGRLANSHAKLLAAAEEALSQLSDCLDILPSRHADARNLVGGAQAGLKKAAEEARRAQTAAQQGEGGAEGASPGSPGPQGSVPPTPGGAASILPGPPSTMMAGGTFFMTDVLADAQADKLRERLKMMASQLAELHGIAEQKNAMLEVAEKEKAELVRRLRAGGAGLGDGGEGGMVTREEFDEAVQEADALKAQLVECLEEQSLKEREIGALSQDLERYRHKFQGFEDQKRLLYREYVREAQQWRSEREGLRGQVARLQADRDEAQAAAAEYKRGVEAVQRGTEEEVRAQYGDAVRRMALVSMRSARLARELESSSAAEKSLQREKAELEAEIADMGGALRTRMRYLERAKEAADRRVTRLYRELDVSIPCKAYEMLVEKHAALQRAARKRTEEGAEAVMAEEELLNLRDEVSHLTKQVFELLDELAHEKEGHRQADRLAREGVGGGARPVSVGTGSARAEARPMQASVVSSQAGGSHPEDVAELVRLRVGESNSRKRAELEQRKSQRAIESEGELRARLSDVEQQLADSAQELHAAQESNKLYRERLQGSLPQAEAAALKEQMEVLQAATSEAEKALSECRQHTRQLEETAAREKRSHMLQLATITQLRTALREIASGGDGPAEMAKLHEEINHVRSKEACVRNQLIRSEQERNKLQDENSSLRRELSSRDAAVGSLQDSAHFVARERHELLAQLEAGLQGRVEGWRAERWRRKLEDVKSRNDTLAADLDNARHRALAQERRAERAEMEREAVASLEEILQRPVAEAYRQCAQLTEASLHQRLETSKVRRELGLQTEKVRYQERVIAELEARLEEYESEAFRNQSAFEAERLDHLAKIRSLEEQLLTVGSKADHQDPHSTLQPRGGGGGITVRSSWVDGNEEAQQRRRADRMKLMGRAAEDRDEMLAQVEAQRALRQGLAEAQGELKAARQSLADLEYAHGMLKTEYEDLVAQMARERERRLASDEALAAVERRQDSGSDNTLHQVRAVAEQRIQQLERRLQERDGELEGARRRADEGRQQYLLQHERDREEIERLNDALYDRNESTIDAMRNNAAAAHAIRVGDDTDRTMTYDQLQRLLNQRDGDLEQARNRLEQLERQLELAERNASEESQQKDEIIAQLQADLAGTTSSTTRVTRRTQDVERLKRELSEKSGRLQQLKAALKAMEQQMISVQTAQVDENLRKSTFEEQVVLDQRLKAADKEKRSLNQKLLKVEADLAAATSNLNEQSARHEANLAELEELRKKLAAAQQDLTRERRKVQTLKNQRDTAAALNVDLKKADPKVAGVLENRVKVLEAQNARLRAAVGAERGPMEQAAALQVADEEQANRERRAQGSPGPDGGDGRPGTGGGGGGGGGGKPVRKARPDYSGDSDPRVKQWEENKKLKDRIQKLRDALASKTKAAEEMTKDRDRRAQQVSTLQEDLRRAKEMLASSQRGGQAGAAGGRGRPMLSEAQKMRELVAEANAVVEERDRLMEEVERWRLMEERRSVAREQGRREDEAEAVEGLELLTEESRQDLEAAMYAMRLERDHAQAQAARLKAQLEDLFGEQVLAPAAAAGVRKAPAGKKGGASARETELEATVDALQRALDRATREAKLSVPNTKYMALLEKKKALARQVAELQGAALQGDRSKSDVKALEMRCASLEETNLALRNQLKEGKLHAASHQQHEAETQLQAAKASLQAKEMQIRTLQERVRDLQNLSAGNDELEALREALEEAEEENRDLKTELNAFDPAFFEEIEDLKHEHYQRGLKITRCEAAISDLSRQLGVPPPAI